MSDIDELPNWAVRSVQPGAVASSNVPPGGQTPEPGRRRGRGRGLILALLAVALVGAGAVGAWWLLNRDDGTDVATGSPTTTAAATGDSAGGGQVEAEATSTSRAASTTEAPASAATSSTSSTPADSDETPSSVTSEDIVTDESLITEENPTGAVRYAVFSQGKLYLRGKIPAAEVGERIAQVGGAVVGPENVFVEYEIDPSVPADIPGPLYVEDVVLFGFNSIRVEPAFLPILDLGTLLMAQFPNVRVTVVTRTDSVGSEEANLEVARQRGDAVVNYWVGQGIDRDRVTVDAKGEADASGSDDEQAAALDRRAEFIISGLFD
jgi:outer membrane protein OmpA-like peptidoglycan-associated protein